MIFHIFYILKQLLDHQPFDILGKSLTDIELFSLAFRSVSEISLNFMRSFEWNDLSTFCFKNSLSCSAIMLLNLVLFYLSGEFGMFLAEANYFFILA